MPKSNIIARDSRGREVAPLLAEMMDAIEIGKDAKGKRVVLKPNLCTERKEIIATANTSREVLDAVVGYLREYTDKIIIGESDGMRYSVKDAFNNNGTFEIGKKYDVKVISFTDDETIEVPVPEFKGWGFSKTWLNADIFITVPKIKTHATSYFTGALKNQWGCIPRYDRILLHKKLHKLIGMVNSLKRPDYTVMDGILGMHGRGPINGEPFPLDILLVSNDPVAIDIYAMQLISLKPKKAKHVFYAGEVLKLGETDLGRVNIDDKIGRKLPQAEEGEKDWAIMAMNFISHSQFLTNNLILNDKIFYPIRRTVNKIREVVG